MAKVAAEKQIDAIAEMLDAQGVLDWLQLHPEFVREHPQALEYLQIDHAAGAPSLIEKQIQVLRTRNDQLRERLHDLATAARANEMRVKHTNRLATRLMQADSTEAVVQVLRESLLKDFAVDAVTIGLYTEAAPSPTTGALSVGDDHPARSELKNLIRTGVIECDVVTDGRRDCLFENAEILSAAVVPLDRTAPLGFLAVGSVDAERYTPRAGTLFLDLIAALASAALRRCLG